MNVTLIAAILIVAVFVIIGLCKGFVMAIYSLIATALVLVLTVMLNPYLTGLLKSSDRIYGYFYEKVDDAVNLPAYTDEQCDKVIKNLKLPEKIEQFALDKASELYESADAAGTKLEKLIYGKLTDLILSFISFMITFVLVTVGVIVAFKLLDLISRLPVLNMTNRLLGIALGLCEGLVIIWIFCGIVPLISATSFGAKVIEDIGKSKMLTFLYENNFLAELISGRIFNIL